MNIGDLISGGLSSSLASTIAQKLNIDESKIKWVIAAAVPLIIAALKYNSKEKGQSDNITNALKQHDGSILDNIANVFSPESAQDGTKIMNHVFGQNTEYVTNQLSQGSGLQGFQIGNILSSLAPLVMGYLGKQQQGQPSSSITDILGNVFANHNGASGGILGGLLDNILGGGAPNTATKDGGLGGMLTDLASSFFNKSNNSGQSGSILDTIAGMFGK